MSSSANLDRLLSLPARLIPGTHPLPGARRNAATIQLTPALPLRDTFTSRPKREIWSRLKQYVAPEPATHNQRSQLAIRVLTDMLLISVSYYLSAAASALLAGGPNFRAVVGTFSNLRPAFGVLLLYGTLFTLLGYSERLYQQETIREPRRESRVRAKVVLLSTALVGVAFLSADIRPVPVSRLILAAPIFFLLSLGARSWRRQLVPPHGRQLRNVLIVGAGVLGRRLAMQLQRETTGHHTLRGFLDDEIPTGGDVLGRVKDLSQIVRREFVDEIILSIPVGTEAARRTIWEARRNRIDLKLVPDLAGLELSAASLERFGDIPVLTLCEEAVPAFGLLAKRLFDIALSASGLAITAPVMILIAIAIKLESRGSVFYRAVRIGLKGHPFGCYKFRTMIRNADDLKEALRARNERQGATFKIANDPRVTRVGRFLRRYSLDELPQLWNVLRGEMSLVGPRPHPPDDVQRYQLEDLQRLDVTPGITGLWQVSARQDPSFERSVGLDREYIERWSLAGDLSILWRTLGAVFRGEGA